MYRTRVVLFMVVIIFTGMVGYSRINEEAPDKKEKINIAVTPWPASAPVYIAREKGYFRDEGVEPTLQTCISGHLGLDAVLSGKVDFATVGETPIARAAVNGRPSAIIATICEIERAILIIGRKDKGISVPIDLKGRRIGVVAGTTADFFLNIYLTTSYIDPNDVRIVNLPTDQVVDALLKGEVDAVCTWAPHTMVLRDRLGGNAVVFQDPSLYTMTWNIVATQDFAQGNPECIKRVMRAVVRANRFISEQPAEARAICSKSIGTNSPLFEKEWLDYRFNVELDQSLILNLEDQARWMLDKEGAGDRRLPNFIDFIQAEGLKAASAEAVRITGK